MIKLNYNEKTYNVKNSVDEFLINEFEDICGILNNKEKNYLQKWSEIFIYLGVPEDVVDDFDSFAFIEIIKQFNIHDLTQHTNFVKEIELDGNTYVCFDEKFKITVKEMTLIESAINKNENRYLGDVLAILYKRENIQKELHYDKAHLKYKAELIRKEIKAEVAIPIIAFLSKKLIKDYELITNED